MRLIDADALIRIAMSDGHYDLVHAVEIERAATIEPKRGKWVEARICEMPIYPDGQKMCSVCKTIMPYTWEKMPPYCFGCGAKMDKEG